MQHPGDKQNGGAQILNGGRVPLAPAGDDPGWPTKLQPSVAISSCKKTYAFLKSFYFKAKPYLGFQNLGCHCKF